MVNDIKIPDFNLEDQFSIDGENAPKSTPKKAENAASEAPPAAPPKVPQEEEEEVEATAPAASKPKPKLLFEEEEGMDDVAVVSRAAIDESEEEVAAPPPRRERKKREKDDSEEPVKEKVKKERKPISFPKINKKILIIALAVILLGGGAYFAYTTGLFGTLYSKASDLKNSLFAVDTLSVATVDTTAAVKEEHDADEEKSELEQLYESQFLRQPAETQAVKSTETQAAKPAETQAAKPAETQAAKSTEAEKPKTTAAAPQQTAAAAKPAPTATAASKSTGKYSIQVSAWQSQSVARSEARKITNKGLDAKVVSVNLGQKGTWYRVMVGSYSTQEEAGRDLSRALRIAESESGIIREN